MLAGILGGALAGLTLAMADVPLALRSHRRELHMLANDQACAVLVLTRTSTDTVHLAGLAAWPLGRRAGTELLAAVLEQIDDRGLITTLDCWGDRVELYARPEYGFVRVGRRFYGPVRMERPRRLESS
ncbi:hypothetical protein [Aeromicrobium alkaliterrae]|uniref:N-acetyltransferase domain-containing protein n=1 Tax=Aeromicrobium alkaliterrae TaxID=302168 RepID=A0ABP4WEI8_9ACTN